MPKIKNTRSAFKAGMFLLETLTAGMYNDPLTIYREYIQNAVDSIDLVANKNSKNSFKVNINLEPINKKITFFDNGTGLPAKIAEKTLSAIGSSNKADTNLRGFRGIGRLGGLAFCEKAIFKTKAENENIESVQEWDCKELKSLLANSKKNNMTLGKLFNKTTNFYQLNSRRKRGSYFVVELEGVSSFRNYIFDIKKVYDYLSTIAPVPFDPESFSHGDEINRNLSMMLKNYSPYDIYLNDVQVYKPYKNQVKITKKGYDYIDKINFFDIRANDETFGYGWLGERRGLLGALAKGEKSSGIRVRLGNIQIGDDHLLNGCFRESRFNAYTVGEIHVSSNKLVPNSRRDDFVDNDTKTLFYNAIVREIGLPLSREIRYRSRVSSKKLSDNVGNGESKTSIDTGDTISILELKKTFKKYCNNCPNLDRIIKQCIVKS